MKLQIFGASIFSIFHHIGMAVDQYNTVDMNYTRIKSCQHFYMFLMLTKQLIKSMLNIVTELHVQVWL